jgi:hypothetical protein
MQGHAAMPCKAMQLCHARPCGYAMQLDTWGLKAELGTHISISMQMQFGARRTDPRRAPL